MKQSDRAWIAGIFEGEGSIGVQYDKGNRPKQKRTSLAIALQIGMNDRDVLDHLCELVGFGKVYGPYRTKGRNNQLHFRWVALGAKNANEFLTLVGPWLFARRTEQFRVAIAAHEKRYRRCSECQAEHYQCEKCYLKGVSGHNRALYIQRSGDQKRSRAF